MGNTHKTKFDALNRPISEEDARGKLVTTTFDAANNPILVQQSTGLSSTPIQSTRTAYDYLNRPTLVEDAVGTSVARTTTTVYDTAAGSLIHVQAPEQRVTTQMLDDLGRVTQRVDGEGHSMVTAYDMADNVLSVTDAENNVSQFGYDHLNRQTWMEDPLRAIATSAFDKADRPTSTTDRGELTSHFDGDGRLTERAFGGDAGLGAKLTWTDCGDLATITYFRDAALTTQVSQSSYTYDAADRLTQLQHRDSSSTLLANYHFDFDKADRVATMTYNSDTTSSSIWMAWTKCSRGSITRRPSRSRCSTCRTMRDRSAIWWMSRAR